MTQRHHPADVDLLALAEGDPEAVELADHLADCPACSRRLDYLRTHLHELGDLPAQPSAAHIESLLMAARSGSSPEFAAQFSAAATADPAVGDVWRVLWDDVAHLAMLTSVDESYVHLIPVTLDHTAADDSAVVLDKSAVSLPAAPVLWPAIEVGVEPFVLERWFGHLLDEMSVQALRRAGRRGTLGELTWAQVGAPAAGPADPRNALRSELVADFNFLGHAQWVPLAWRQADAPSLAAVLTAHEWTPEQLMVELAVSSNEAIALWRGNREATAQQLARLTELVGEDLSALTVHPDTELIASLNAPTFRSRLVAIAAGGRDEAELRRQVVLSALQPAARQARPAGDRDWPSLIDNVLRGMEQG